MSSYDVIVIGAGPVGENVADRVRAGGLSAAVIEAELVGGECSYWACVPSKAMLRPGAALNAARRVDGASQAVAGDVDAEAALRRRDHAVSDWDDSGQVDWLKGTGAALLRGRARLTGPRRVSVTGTDGATTELEALHAVVISTGSDPRLPDIPGLADVEPWTSRDATGAQEVPGRLIVFGGGTVGCEMATAYLTLGADVTIVSRSPLLSGQEPFAGEAVTAALRDAGATVHLGRTIARAERNAAGEVVLTLDDGTVVTGGEVLVATGRVARTQELGLESIGLEPGAWLEVDDTLRVRPHGNPALEGDWLYAVGDVNHRALLTHQGKYQARAAGDVIVARAAGGAVDGGEWGVHAATADHRAVPEVTFTDPEVASVGLTASAAEKNGINARVLDYDLGAVSGAKLRADGYTGHVRAVVDLDHEVIVGLTLVGQDVGELIHAATIAVVGEVPIDRLWHAVPAFPTISEFWLRLLEEYGRPAAED